MGTYANFYNSENNDRVYDADSFSEWLRPFFKTGVFNGELQVIASSGMEVIVDTGNAFIEGKLKKFDAQTTLTVEQASANSTRIDAVVCRRNDTDRDFTLMIVKGTTVAPLPVRENGIYDIVLAHITVPASAVEIKQENITDTRMNADICGWVVSNIEEVDFDQVTAQWADYIANFEADELQAFNEWFDSIKGQLSTDQAGSLQLQIDEQANKIATNTANISANKADITSLQQTTTKNTRDIQAIKDRDDEQDSSIANLNNATRINLLKPTLQTQTQNGVTITNNGDGTYTLNSTASSTTSFAFFTTLKKGTYKFNGCPSQGSLSTYSVQVKKENQSGSAYGEDNGNGLAFTVVEESQVVCAYIRIQSGYTCNNLLFKPMITPNLNATYDDFVSYEDSLATNKVMSTRVNLLKPTLQTQTKNGVTCTNNGDGTYTLNGKATTQVIFLLLNTTVNVFNGMKMLGCPSGGSTSTYCLIVSYYNEANKYQRENYDNGIGKIIENYEKIQIGILIRSGTVCNNLVFKPMITPNLNATYNDFISCLGTSWTKDTTNGYYNQSIICSGITSSDNPTIDVVLSGTLEEMKSQQEDWGKILKVETSTDTLTFYASEPTTVSLSVMVKGV